MDLKPCPFCGGEAAYKYYGQPATHHIIRCSECEAEGPPIDVDMTGSMMPCEDQSRPLAETIAAWNQRVSQWVSVKDRLPDYREGLTQSRAVLVTEDFDEYEVAWYAHGRWVIHDSFNITHWMPITGAAEK